MTSPITGSHGVAHDIEIPDHPSAVETVAIWLIKAPGYHPLWSQFVLAVVRLRAGIAGMPEPKLQFVGATHELIVTALDPDHPRQPDDDWTQPLRRLDPVNIAEQFTATDDEMVQLARAAAGGVVRGVLNPETADAPTRIREGWLTALVKTLAHIRGEEHSP